jgi:hypothetical protein
MTRANRSSRGRAAIGTVCVLILLAARAISALDASEDRRAAMGARLFRAMLDADVELPRKTLPDGRLLVVFLHQGDAARAERLATEFATAGKGDKPQPIAGLPLSLELSSDPSLAAYAGRPLAGVFLTESPDGKALRRVIDLGIARRVVVYSPFDGDVERGVLGGLSVEAQVRLFVNAKTLAASNVTFKALFLKSCKVLR